MLTAASMRPSQSASSVAILMRSASLAGDSAEPGFFDRRYAQMTRLSNITCPSSISIAGILPSGLRVRSCASESTTFVVTATSSISFQLPSSRAVTATLRTNGDAGECHSFIHLIPFSVPIRGK